MFDQWPLVEADLHERYGIDVDDRPAMRARSWQWLVIRMNGLASCESRINAWARERFEHQHPKPKGG